MAKTLVFCLIFVGISVGTSQGSDVNWLDSLRENYDEFGTTLTKQRNLPGLKTQDDTRTGISLREFGETFKYEHAVQGIDPIQLIYLDCSSNDLINGVKLGSLLDYVMEKLGIQVNKGELNPMQRDADTLFAQYSDLLSRKLGGYEPHSQSLSTTVQGTIVQANIEEFVSLLWPDPTSGVVKVVGSNLFHLLRTRKGPSLVSQKLSSFLALEIHRSADNVEMVLSLFEVMEKKTAARIEFGTFGFHAQGSTTLEERKEERKFILDKFAIQQIVENLTLTTN